VVTHSFKVSKLFE